MKKQTLTRSGQARPADKNTPASVTNAAKARKASPAPSPTQPHKTQGNALGGVSRKPRHPRKALIGTLADAWDEWANAGASHAKPPTSKRGCRPCQLESLTVRLSSRQARLIRHYAYALRATPGDMLLSLAMSEIGATKDVDAASVGLDSFNSALIEFVVRRRVPADGSKRLIGITHLPTKPSMRKDGEA